MKKNPSITSTDRIQMPQLATSTRDRGELVTDGGQSTTRPLRVVVGSPDDPNAKVGRSSTWSASPVRGALIVAAPHYVLRTAEDNIRAYAALIELYRDLFNRRAQGNTS